MNGAITQCSKFFCETVGIEVEYIRTQIKRATKLYACICVCVCFFILFFKLALYMMAMWDK